MIANRPIILAYNLIHSVPHLGQPCILDQVSGQAEAHGQGLQLQ